MVSTFDPIIRQNDIISNKNLMKFFFLSNIFRDLFICLTFVRFRMTSDVKFDVDEEIFITNHLSNDDIPSLIKYLNNPKIIRNTLAIPSPYKEIDGETFINEVRTTSNDSLILFSIRLKTNDEMIGCCGFHRVSKTNERRAEIGYWLAEPFWGRGLMAKVLKKAIEIVRQRWTNFVRLEAKIYPWNKSSMRVVEKCGFQFEGIHRKALHKNGEDIDEHCFALIFD